MPDIVKRIKAAKKAFLGEVSDKHQLPDPPSATPVLAATGDHIASMYGRSERESEIIGGLLRGTGTLFGARVELSWPDGLPKGFTEETLKDFGRSMLGRANA